ncbi:NADPH:quinone oxidoreductase family protein, partial [Saccharopolyspora shandongensis]
IDVVGVGWGAYARPRPGYLHWQWSQIEPHIASSALSAPIGGSYPLDDAISALKAIDDRQATGKLVLKIR